jgi:hypothetical protein
VKDVYQSGEIETRRHPPKDTSARRSGPPGDTGPTPYAFGLRDHCLGPVLTIICLTLDAARTRLHTDPAAADRHLCEAREAANQALGDLREVVLGLPASGGGELILRVTDDGASAGPWLPGVGVTAMHERPAELGAPSPALSPQSRSARIPCAVKSRMSTLDRPTRHHRSAARPMSVSGSVRRWTPFPDP